MNCNCVIVAGYFYTGSSAVVDLLKEYRGAVEINTEFRLIKDPYGLNDLRYNIVEHWDPLNSDNAIKDFLWLAKHLGHINTKYSLVRGLDYSNDKVFGDLFMTETLRYIESITDYQYSGSWWFTDFKQSKIERLKEKTLKAINHPVEHFMFFSHCTSDEFDINTTQYLENLLGLSSENKESFVILDQGFSAQNVQNLNKFFKKAKMIIVDRDPRDVYSEMIDGVGLISNQIKKTRNAELFVKWYKAYHSCESAEPDNILHIRFEDLVSNYTETVNLIESFLGLEQQNHISKKKYLNVDISQNNIGKWKNILNREEILTLMELKDYFWN